MAKKTINPENWVNDEITYNYNATKKTLDVNGYNFIIKRNKPLDYVNHRGVTECAWACHHVNDNGIIDPHYMTITECNGHFEAFDYDMDRYREGENMFDAVVKIIANIY